MKNQLTRRDLIGRAGLALGGAIALGSLPSCGSEEAGPCEPQPTPGTNTTTEPLVSDFPYEKHLQASYRLDVAAIKEAAYHGYYAGGCCHGAYRALLEHLANTAGAPFNKLPLDFGKFGGGGIASYGSICGALLGSVLVINSIVADVPARTAMLTDLMRWYEGYSFPNYVPTAVDAAETGLTKDFSAGAVAQLAFAPRSHLCHASVSSWCAEVNVSASGADKKARCARLTADVAGKTAEVLNAYLASKTYTAAHALDSSSASCVSCHPASSTTKPPSATGMSCGSCHGDKLTGHPIPQ